MPPLARAIVCRRARWQTCPGPGTLRPHVTIHRKPRRRRCRHSAPPRSRRARRGPGARLVVRVLLLRAGGLLRDPAGARGDGRHSRAAMAADAVCDRLSRHGGRRAAVRLGGVALREAPHRPGRLRVLHRLPGAVLAAHDHGRGRGAGGGGILRLGQRVQPVRGVAVLERDGRHLFQRPGQAPLRSDRRGRQRRRDLRADHHPEPGAHAGPRQSAPGLRRLPGHRPAGSTRPARGDRQGGWRPGRRPSRRTRGPPGSARRIPRRGRPARGGAQRPLLALSAAHRPVGSDRQPDRHLLLFRADPHRGRLPTRPTACSCSRAWTWPSTP